MFFDTRKPFIYADSRAFYVFCPTFAGFGASFLPPTLHCAFFSFIDFFASFSASGAGASSTSSPQSPYRYQSSPSNSAGCWVRSEPLPQPMASFAQYLSHPQQIRSGCLGCRGNFFAICIAMYLATYPAAAAAKFRHYTPSHRKNESKSACVSAASPRTAKPPIHDVRR